MTERRMDAYYYGFDKTGVEVVDKILGAVACAGKAYHHTDDWNEKTNFPYDDHTGETPIEWIQNAAKEAAARIEALEKALEAIAEGDVPRKHTKIFRKDGVLSKHDACEHGRVMYEDCDFCIALFARAALEGKDD